ncbi:hypothetical protein D3C81_2070950 [compost metagenome]
MKLSDHCREKARPHHRRQADADMPALQLAQTVQLCGQIGEGLHNILCLGQQDLTCIRQTDTLPLTVEQIRFKLLLEVTDHFADGRLGDKQGFRRSGEALQPRCLHKIL